MQTVPQQHATYSMLVLSTVTVIRSRQDSDHYHSPLVEDSPRDKKLSQDQPLLDLCFPP